MNPKIDSPKFELVVITNVNPVGDVEGEIISRSEADQTINRKISFSDHPPVSVGDKILARVLSEPDSEKPTLTTIGKYIRKAGNNPKTIIGIFKNLVDGPILIPTDKKNKARYRVDKNNIEAIDGELFEAQIKNASSKSRYQSVNLIRSLGDPFEKKRTSMIAVEEYRIPNKFSDQIQTDALQRANISTENPTDLTNIPFISIDPDNAKDHDDAICALKDPANPDGYIIWVAIADVTKYVLEDSAIDLEALKRGNSTYFPDLVIPMLPDVLSSNMCSLKEGEIRAALAVKIWVNNLGQKTDHCFFRCTIRNEIASSYEEVQNLLDNAGNSKPKTKLKKLLEPIHCAYKLLRKQTKLRDPLELEIVEHEILFNTNGKVSAVKAKERLKSHKIIEEFMVLANICAAETIKQHKLAFLYRVHEPPTFEKFLSLRNVAQSLGFKLNINTKVTGRDLNNLLKKAQQNNCSELVSNLILRSMSQAHYYPQNQGHFGLNLPYYTHFTSPIRRYSDILIHRALIHIHKWSECSKLKEQAVLFKIGDQLSKTERRSVLAERDTKDRFLASFLTDKKGEDFSAKINGFSRSGIFVRLDEIGADGLIPLSFLYGDRYNLNKEKNKLIGRSSKTTFVIGASVLVKLEEADPISGSLIFNLINHKSKPMLATKKFNRKKKKKHKARKLG